MAELVYVTLCWTPEAGLHTPEVWSDKDLAIDMAKLWLAGMKGNDTTDWVLSDPAGDVLHIVANNPSSRAEPNTPYVLIYPCEVNTPIAY